MFMETSPLIDYLCFRRTNKLSPFAMWPAFPTSDYYDDTDAPHVSPPGYRLRFVGSLSRS